MVGGTGAAVTVKVTDTVRGVLVAPAAVTVIVALWVPAVTPARFTVAVRVPGAVDPEAVRISHPALLPAPQLMVPPPVLVTLSVWAEGFAPPCTPLNVRLA